MNRLAVTALLILGATTTSSVPASPPLFLTPYIRQNQVSTGRNLSVVDPSLFLNVTSYAGYLTVNEKYNSNLFFWYFPAEKQTKDEKTPWIIWLQGGPGASSLAGLFVEIGPFYYDKGHRLIKLRESSWLQKYSLLFIDNPVGAGFSFTDSPDGFVRGMDDCSEQLYSALQQFLVLFPEQRSSPLFLAGESYAGHYLPALAHRILHPPQLADLKINETSVNLKGIMMGNPVVDRRDEVNLTSVYYNWGLLDQQGLEAVRPLQDEYAKWIKNGDNTKAKDARDKLLDKLDALTAQPQSYNVLKDDLPEVHDFEPFLTSAAVVNAIHAGNTRSRFTFSNGTVHTMLVKDFLVSMTPTVNELLEHYRIMIYCGQLDLTAPCVLNAEARRETWHWSGRDKFLTAARYPWMYKNEIAGYVKSGGGFTEVLVRGAGHLAPMDKPKEVFTLIDYFIRDLDLPSLTNYDVQNISYKPHQLTPTPKPVSPSNSGFIASIVLNFVFVATIIIGAVLWIRWKRRTDTYFYSTVDTSSLNGVLTMD